MIEPRHFRLLVTWFDLSPSCHTVESTCHLCKYNVHYWDTYLSVFFYEVNNHDRWWIFHLPIQGISGNTPVLLLQPTERGAWWQLGQPTGWLATMHLSHAFLGDTSYAWEPYISGQYVSTMVYSFNALGCQLICNVGRQLESVLNIFTFLSTAINLRLPVGYIPAT